MALPLFREKRFSPRKQLTGLLPGKLYLSESGDNLTCKLVDVSRHGIGMTTKTELKFGDRVTLEFEDQKIEFKVAWIQHGFSKQDIYRAGLICNDINCDMIDLFTEAGCLK